MSNTAVLDENGIATVAGDITVYHYDEETRNTPHPLWSISPLGGYSGTFVRRCTAGGNFGLRGLPDCHAERVGACA